MLSFTLQDITNKLFQFFIENNAVDLEQNHSDIFEVSIDVPLERAALLKSLDKFQEQKLVSLLDVDGKSVFLLNQPLQSYKQQVEITGVTAGKIATVVNSWLEENGKADYAVNPMEINELAIQVMIHISETALSRCS